MIYNLIRATNTTKYRHCFFYILVEVEEGMGTHNCLNNISSCVAWQLLHPIYLANFQANIGCSQRGLGIKVMYVKWTHCVICSSLSSVDVAGGGVQIEMWWEELKSSDQWPDDDLKDQPSRHSEHSTKLYLSTTNHNFDMILPSNWRWVEFYL